MTSRFAVIIFVTLFVTCWPVLGNASKRYEQSIEQVRQLSKSGNYEEAQRILALLERHFPNNSELLAFRGRVALWQRQYAMAARYLQRSLVLRKDPVVVKELQHAQNFEQLELAAAKVTAGELAQAEITLKTLCSQQKEAYESCQRLGLLQLKQGKQAAARETFLLLRQLYPDDADIALLSLRPLKDSGACSQAQREFVAFPGDWQQRLDAQELLLELKACCQEQEKNAQNQQNLKILEQAQQLVAQGDTEKGLQQLLGLLQPEITRYQAGTQAAAILMEKQHYQQAQGLYYLLMHYFPKDASIREAHDRAEIAIFLHSAAEKYQQGQLQEARDIWKKLFDTGRETYISGIRLGALLIAERRYAEAIQHYKGIIRRYPDEAGLRERLIEAFVRKGDIPGARREMLVLTQNEQVALRRDRSDLLYLLKPNNLRLSGGIAGGVKEQPYERQISAALSQRLGERLSFVLQGSSVERYGKHDAQMVVDIYYKPAVLPDLLVMLGASCSPDASFLPRYAVNAEVTKSLGLLDIMFGVSHLAFADATAQVLTPGSTWYFSDAWQLTERLYINADNGAVSAVTRVGWSPDYRVKGSLGITSGQASDRIGAAEDLRRYFTLGVTSYAEYRFKPELSLGAELFYEHREGLYNKAGGSLFGRYWW